THQVDVTWQVETGIAARPTRSRGVSLQMDARGRLLARSETVGGVTSWTRFTYDARGQMKTRTEPSGGGWSWAYDAAGYLVSTSSPMDQPGEVVTTFTNDAAGLVTNRVGPRPGEVWTMTYDALARPKSRSLAATPGVLQADWTFQYGSYNSLDPVPGAVRETDPGGVITERRYNPKGQ